MSEIIEKIYELCKDRSGKVLDWETFYEEVQSRGIRKHDLRLRNLTKSLFKRREKISEFKTFKELIFKKCLKNQQLL
jgi:EF-hand domain